MLPCCVLSAENPVWPINGTHEICAKWGSSECAQKYIHVLAPIIPQALASFLPAIKVWSLLGFQENLWIRLPSINDSKLHNHMSFINSTDKHKWISLLFIMSLTCICSICKNSCIIKATANTSMVYETCIQIWEYFLNFTSQLNIWIDVLFNGGKNPAELKL